MTNAPHPHPAESPLSAEVPVGRSGWSPFDVGLVDGTVHGAFERQVRATPDAVALAGPGGMWTYAEVDARATAVAHQLVACGSEGRAVAVAMAHDTDLVVAVFAVLKAGAALLILDIGSPAEVNRAIVADGRPAALVTDDAGAELAGALSDIVVTRSWAELVAAAGPDEPAPLPQLSAGDPAMLAYSSGTTGGPKAAVLPHRALVHLFRGATDALKIGPGDRLPMIFPISLAVAAYPMFLPLMVGGSLRIHDVRSHGLVGFPEWLADQQISVLYVSPTVARFMGEVPDGIDLSALRLVVLGGERVDADAIAIVRTAFGDQVTVANGYGATETGVLTFFVVRDGAEFGPLGVPVGLPIPEVELRIVGDDGRTQPDGEAGELHVRSRYLFSGYWNRPDLTASVLSDADGVALYRTGDIGFIDPNGNLAIIGRSDTEVKVRGHRVIPGEVEQALLSLVEVADAVVEARPDPMGTNQLVAWVVPTGGNDLRSVRAAAKRVVRGPLVPRQMVVVEALPQLPNGKLDRRALPLPPAEAPASGAHRPPSTPTETRLGAIWEEILGIRPLGVDADLIDLGAQSFDLAWALVQIEERLKVRVPMSSLLEVRTVAELAEVVEDLVASGEEPDPVVEVQPGQSGRPLLFVVHDLHGTAYGLRHLAPAIGTDQAVWGFESPFLEGRADGIATLEDLAERYVTRMRRVQASGPYHLAGYSFGGVLAFEIARQLQAAGDEVPFLGIVDVGPGYRGKHYDSHKMLDKPWSRVPMPPDASLALGDKVAWYRDLAKRSPKDLAYHLSLRSGLDRWVDPVQFRWDIRMKGAVPPHRRLWYAWRQHWELGRRYHWEGPAYRGDLLLIWAEESAATDATMGWRSVVDGDITIVRTDAPHERMLQPAESIEIGWILREGLDNALARSNRAP
jgi:amino acid adenylation domain-containing protein